MDGRREVRTGFGPEYSEDADELWEALADYRATRAQRPRGPRTPERMMIGDALTLYGREHAPTTAAPERIGYAIAALEPYWAGLTVSAINGATCRRYARQRGVAPGTVRKELGTLHAALAYCEEEGALTSAPAVWLPEKPESKDRWMTRGEAARLLRAARAEPKARHLCRFILIGLYTGTRKTPILNLQWTPNTEGGHVDTARGLLYRKSKFARKTKKRQTPCKIPRQLLAHLRRWESLSRQHVVEYDGQPVKQIKRAWATACARAGLSDVTPHTLKHTAVTWSMQRGGNKWDKAGFFGTTFETLERNYAHHHPDFQASAVEAMERK
jgi:integrase